MDPARFEPTTFKTSGKGTGRYVWLSNFIKKKKKKKEKMGYQATI